MCFVQTLQMVKVNCSSEGQRGFYKCAAIGQSKFRRSRDLELRGDIMSRQIRIQRINAAYGPGEDTVHLLRASEFGFQRICPVAGRRWPDGSEIILAD
jgi:hypothetical protein